MSKERSLGRKPPSDWRHVERYGLTAATLPDKPTPVVAGVNWYGDFDTPVRDRAGFWIVGKDAADLGAVRGGHCFCFKPDAIVDPLAWWRFYDQGSEGACVGFGCSRAMSLLNRQRYDAPWLYREAKRVDEWPGEDYDGTSVRAGFDVLRTEGGRRVNRGREGDPTPASGIASNRWATSVEDAVAAMHSPRYLELGRAPFLNSWGAAGYPHTVWMPLETLARLLAEDGELGVIFDR